MKKLIALLLTIIMMMSIGNVFAEEMVIHNAFETFDFQVATPEGYTMTQEQINNVYLINYTIPDEDKVNYTITIAYSELYDEQTMCDLTQEEKDLFVSLLALNYSNPIISYFTTEDETELVILDESIDEVDFITIATIEVGYVVEMHITHEDYAQVTDEEYEIGVQIFNDFQVL